MDFSGITNVLDWIETNVINGFLGSGFTFLRDFFINFLQIKSIIDLITSIFTLGS